MAGASESLLKEFRDYVVAVVHSREAGVMIKEIADDLGISEACFQNWLRKADVEFGRRPSVSVIGSLSRSTRSCTMQRHICLR